MLPFLGNGALGAERGAKLALICKRKPSSLDNCVLIFKLNKAGLKEGLYDPTTLAEYLLYRLNNLNPKCKPFLCLAALTSLLLSLSRPCLPSTSPAEHRAYHEYPRPFDFNSTAPRND